MNHSPPPTPGFFRIWDILGSKKRGIKGLLPISKTSFYQGIRDGRYPAQKRPSPRVSVWVKSEIYALIDSIEKEKKK